MSENIQSKLDTALISLTLAVAIGGLKFWRDVSISVARLEQGQIVSSSDVMALRARMNEVENESRRNWTEVQADIIRLKFAAGMK